MPTFSHFLSPMRLVLFFSAAFSILIALAGCSQVAPPEGPYAPWLSDGESVQQVQRVGPFTVLDVEYSSCCGYLMSSRLSYQRILHAGKILLRKTDRTKPFDGFGRPVLATYDGLGGESFKLVYEQSGKPVVEKIDVGIASWGGEEGFEYGYPIAPATRYFPRHDGGAGFILTAFPVKLQRLAEAVYRADELAGLSPDGKWTAYAGCRDNPALLIVVDAKGEQRQAFVLDGTSGPTAQAQDISPYARLMRWFNAGFRWVPGPGGTWTVTSQAKGVRELTEQETSCPSCREICYYRD